MRKINLLIIFLCFLTASSSAQKKVTPFKKNDRVVFAGNSITEAGLYGSYVWLYYMTHFPDRRIDVINGGVGGDVAEQIYMRLDSDLLAKKPTVLAVTFGMNDSKYFEYLGKTPMSEEQRAEIVQQSYKSYQKIEAKLKQLPGITKILMSSSPYDETAKMPGNLFIGKSKTMERIIDFQLKSAKANNWGYVDFFYPMTAINKREQIKRPEYTNTGTDRIHPGGGGHLIMAYLFLKSQGLENLPVADVNIDAKAKKLRKTDNATISNLKYAKENISFDYLAKSLPFPMDTMARLWGHPSIQTEALSVIPFTNEFNKEQISVIGLTGNNYQLKIDGQFIGQWSGKDFEKGINLAVLKNTPQYKQSLEILNLNNERRNIEAKYRNYYWVEYNFLQDKGLLFNRTNIARDTINNHIAKNGWLNAKKDDYFDIAFREGAVRKQMQGFIDQIYAINKPKKHFIEIVAANKN